ncbi:MAG: cytidylyltransferase domain-containing protein [Candidatus Limnocylindrales bacterium]
MAIVQARMKSSRLPGKVMAPILGRPILVHVLERVARAQLVDETVVATTVDQADDPVAALADQHGWPVVRGQRDDVLDRYVQAARERDAGLIVRITSDCPLIDPEVIDAVIASMGPDDDYASNTLEPRTYPRGLDCEVITRSALEQAWRDDQDPSSREHVTPFIYRHPERFKLRRVANETDESGHRWCVDVQEDLDLVRRIYDVVGSGRVSWTEVLEASKAHPEWRDLNSAVAQKTIG